MEHKLLILDMDMTLALPKDPAFYRQYGQKTEEAIAEYFDLSAQDAHEVANHHRTHHGGAEHALFSGEHKPADYGVLHRKLSEIDVKGVFHDQSQLRAPINHLRRNGTKVVVLTSSPDGLANRILHESGFNPDYDFDAVYAYEANKGPQKIIDGTRAFADVMNAFAVTASQTLCVGDSILHDVDPALKLGADAVAISPHLLEGYKTIPSLETFLKTITQSLK